MKKIIAACSVNGVMFGFIKLFYELTPLPMTVLLYCTFLGFTVTFAVGADAKKFLQYMSSILFGIVWVAGFILFEKIFLLTSLPVIASKAIAFGVMSFVIEVANVKYLKDTCFGFIPLQFAVVIGVFSQQCQHIPFILTALVIGIFAALLSKKIYEKML